MSVGQMLTPLTELVGVRTPPVQTGMGWVAGPCLVSGTANASDRRPGSFVRAERQLLRLVSTEIPSRGDHLRRTEL